MKQKVLILCTGNSARSQMAEALINFQRGDRWDAVSAGTQPAERANPNAIAALKEIGIDTEGSKPTHINDFLNQTFDLVVTVCDDAAESCPVWPGQGERVHISFPDPAQAQGTPEEIMMVFRQVRDDIGDRVLALIDSKTTQQ